MNIIMDKNTYKRFFSPNSSYRTGGDEDINVREHKERPIEDIIKSREEKEEEKEERKSPIEDNSNDREHEGEGEEGEEDEEEEEEEDEEEEEEEEDPMNPILNEKADLSNRNISDNIEKVENLPKNVSDKISDEISDETIEGLQESTETSEKYDYPIKENLMPYPSEVKGEKTTIHLCLYSIDHRKPFIQYLLCLSNNLYDFPSYSSYSHIDNSNVVINEVIENIVGGGDKSEDGEEAEAEDGDETEAIWFDEFKTQFFQIFPDRIAKYFMPDMKHYYKGVIEQDFESSVEIFIFFDISPIPVELLKDNPFGKSLIPENFILSPIHEFYNLRAIGNTPVNSQIEKLFYDNRVKNLLELRELGSQKPVEYPYVLFLCDKEAGFFGSSSYKNKLSDPIDSLILPKIDHEKAGEFYFFTSTPLDKAASNLRRFAVFIDEESTLFIKKGEEEQVLENLYSEDAESYSAIYMHDGDTQFWIIKRLSDIIEL